MRRQQKKESLVEVAHNVFDDTGNDESGSDQNNESRVHNNNRVNET